MQRFVYYYLDRVLVRAAFDTAGRAAWVQVGGVATCHVAPALGVVPIPWRGRTVELRFSPVGHRLIGLDIELRSDGEPVPPLKEAATAPFAGPACPGCGCDRPDASDGTRCRACFEADLRREASWAWRYFGGQGLFVAVVAGALGFGAWVFAGTSGTGMVLSLLAGASALGLAGASLALLGRAKRGTPGHTPTAPPTVRWNLDVLRVLETVDATAGLDTRAGPAWDRMRDTMVSVSGVV